MKTFTIIYTVTESILAITAIVFLAISIFGNPDTNLPLQIALGSTSPPGTGTWRTRSSAPPCAACPTTAPKPISPD